MVFYIMLLCVCTCMCVGRGMGRQQQRRRKKGQKETIRRDSKKVRFVLGREKEKGKQKNMLHNRIEGKTTIACCVGYH